MNNRDLLIREIEIEEAVLGIRADGIVQVFLKDHMELDVELQTRWFEIYEILTGGVKSPFIFQTGVGTTVTKEARENAVLMEEQTPLGATAVVVSSMAHVLIANFYLKFNKPKVPYKVFKDYDSAIKWLQTLDCYQPQSTLSRTE